MDARAAAATAVGSVALAAWAPHYALAAGLGAMASLGTLLMMTAAEEVAPRARKVLTYLVAGIVVGIGGALLAAMWGWEWPARHLSAITAGIGVEVIYRTVPPGLQRWMEGFFDRRRNPPPETKS